MKRTVLMPLAAALALVCCAGSPSAGGEFPDSEWLSYTANAKDRKSAENAALAGLARIFSTNISEKTSDIQEFARVVGRTNKKIAVSEESREFARTELTSSSNVSGLIGVQTETWTARNGTVHVNARMNRRECSQRYAALIRENESLIRSLREEAEPYAGTFDAFEMLNFAHTAARMTDNFYNLLKVLDPSTTQNSPEYGNADALKALATNAAHSIVITVNVEVTGDYNKEFLDEQSRRLSGAFKGYFNQRGFRTDDGGDNSYTLYAVFTMKDVDMGNPRYQFAAYDLTYSLKNRAGQTVFSSESADSDRSAHPNIEVARQRALAAAESSVGSTGFAAKFDAYLASLL